MADVHDGDPVAHRQRLFLVVRDEDEGHADVLLERLQLDLEILAQAGVERPERLVQEQHPGPQHERARERDALLLAAGELVRLSPLEAGELHELEHLRHRALLLRPSTPCGT